MKVYTSEKEVDSSKIDFFDKSVIFIDNEIDVLDELKQDFIYNECKIDNFHFIHNENDIIGLIKEIKADIIVSDFIMPNKDGIKLLEEIREINKEIILVLRTAYVISLTSDEKRRCKDSRIETLCKFDGFESMVANLKKFLKQKVTKEPKSKNLRNISSSKTTSSSNTRFSISKKTYQVFETITMNLIKTVYEDNANDLYKNSDWIKVTEVPTKVLKILYETVQCECLINASLNRTQIREFPKILFNNISDFEENKYLIVKIKLKPGISCTEIIETTDPNFKKYFDVEESDELNDFEINKL